MRKIILFLGCVAALVSFSSACADSDEDQPTMDEDASSEDTEDTREDAEEYIEYETEGPVSQEDYAGTYVQVVCAHVFSCCTEEELPKASTAIGAKGRFSTEEECRRVLGEKVDADIEQMEEALIAGRLVYHADKAGECMREIEAASCDDGEQLRDVSQACEQAFESQVDVGGDCRATDDCREGSCIGVKRNPDDGSVTELGTCLKGEVGDMCDPFDSIHIPEIRSSCATGNFCGDLDYDPDSVLLVGTCKKESQLGEECLANECTEGAYCDSDSSDESSRGTCKERKSAGEACSAGECDAQTFCDTENYNGGICTAPKSGGELCQGDGQCASGNCRATHNSRGDFVCRFEESGEAPEFCIGAE